MNNLKQKLIEIENILLIILVMLGVNFCLTAGIFLAGVFSKWIKPKSIKIIAVVLIVP